ncbi:MAG: hypothetical protein WD872_02445 [Pirellulaceae bacterium]
MATPSIDGQQERVVVELGTPIAEADAAAVASTMQAVVAIVAEAQKQLKSNDALLLKARPFSENSFEIPFELILVGTALAFDNHPLIDEVLQILQDYISIRKLLRGKPLPSPSANGSVVVQGNITVKDSVVNILLNSQVNTIMNKAAADLEADTTINGLKVLRGKQRDPIANIEREELAYFRYDPHSLALDGPQRERPQRTTVIIHTPVLEGRAKWKLILDGHTISADIQDYGFMERVRAGNEVFAAGDRLDVDLVIHEDYTESLATYQPKKYSVMRVYDHFKRPTEESPKLFVEESPEIGPKRLT